MQQVNLFLIFLEKLNNAKFNYMVTGSVASIVYGQPRVTHDIDLVLELQTDKISELLSIFSGKDFYCPPKEVIESELHLAQNGHFNIIHHETGFKADIYFFTDKLSRWAISFRNKVELGKCTVWLAPPEYVIVKKLEYYKEGKSSKHLTDIKSILEISSDLIDFDVLKNKICEQDVLDVWEEIK